MTVCMAVLATAVGTQVSILLGTLWGAMQTVPLEQRGWQTFSAEGSVLTILCLTGMQPVPS